MAAEADLPIGSKLTGDLGTYEVLQRCPGGIGVVYVVRDSWFRGLHALKTFKNWDRANVDTSRSEADLWIRLGYHPNIVYALTVELLRGRPFIVLEYVGGGSLQDRIRGTGCIDTPSAVAYAIQICDALEHATGKDLGEGKRVVAHCDVKPSNVLITEEGSAKLTDFNLAMLSPAKWRKCGTFPYESPEQVFGDQPLDCRTDIYSLGITLCQMLSGTIPLPMEPERYMEFHRRKMPPDLSCLSVRATRTLREIVAKCLQAEPASRYTDIPELRDALAEEYFRITGKRSARPDPRVILTPQMFQLPRGIALARLGRHREAMELFDSLLQVFPDDECVIGNKAVSMMRMGRQEESLPLFEKAIGSATDADFRVRMLVNEAAALIDLQRYMPAIACCDRAIAIASRRDAARLLSGVYGNKGNALGMLGRFEEAIACYRHCVEIDPTDALAYLNWARALTNQGRDEEALPLYEKATRLVPGMAVAHLENGFTNLKLGDLKAAMESFEFADRLGDSDSMSAFPLGDFVRYLALADSLEDQGDFQSALAYRRACRLAQPNIADAWTAEGYCLAHLGRNEEALRCYKRAIDLDRANYMPWMNKAVALYQLGRYDLALASADEVLVRKPGHENAEALAELCRRHLSSARLLPSDELERALETLRGLETDHD